MQWDPTQYTKYGDERGRPFYDLVGQIECDKPARVVDLGCGPGELTASLAERWPNAAIEGQDSSPEMIERAAGLAAGRLSFRQRRAQEFDASGVDVLISNALLQWVPEHRDLLPSWADKLNPGGWIAFQVPSNFGSPSHRLMREVAGSARWRDQVGGVLRHADSVSEPTEYLDLLTGCGFRVNAWQTEYLHILTGADPVLEWVRGTGLRPILDLLSPRDIAEFEAEYATRLRIAYPAHDYGTVYPFLRTFVVAHKPA
ncbi:MAG TPA: trans-aconitate 2-methyltransferase [Jatrophihabitans sp.]|jgi:trans-aconitate 2-methyltransferase